MCTVWSSIFLTVLPLTAAAKLDGLLGTLGARSKVNTTSSAVNGAAVVPGDALAQLELPHGIVDDLPALGEAGHQPLLLVGLDQALEHVAEDRVVGGEIVVVRVHGGGLGREPDLEILRLGPGGEQAEGEGENDNPHRHHDRPLSNCEFRPDACTEFSPMQSIRGILLPPAASAGCRGSGGGEWPRFSTAASTATPSSPTSRPSSAIESPTSDVAGVNRVLDVDRRLVCGHRCGDRALARSTIASATCCACAAIPSATSPAYWC